MTDIYSYIFNFGNIVLGILFAALPFLVLGVSASVILQHFIGRERVLRFYGQSFLQNYLVSTSAGFLFPVCECGIVPIARRLIAQGVPVSGAVMFLLSAPVLNPITLGATMAAFPADNLVWIMRLCISQLLTLGIGWIFQAWVDEKGTPLPLLNTLHHEYDCHHESVLAPRFAKILYQGYQEFIDVFRYVVYGALLTAFLQMVIPRGFLSIVTDYPFLGILAFMLLAGLLSVCSSVDAFVILPFANHAPLSALLAFLNFGPLIDVKNIMLFKAYFSKKFTVWYFGAIIVGVLSLTSIIMLGWPGSDIQFKN